MSREFFRNIDKFSSYEERMRYADEYYKKWYLAANIGSQGEKFAIDPVPQYVLEFFSGAKDKNIYLFSPSIAEIEMFAGKFNKVYFSAMPAIETRLPDNVVQCRYDDNFEIKNGEKELADYAFSHHVIEHIHPKDLEKHMRLVFSYLKTGGEYVIVCPSNIRIWKDQASDNLDKKTAANHHIGRYSYSGLSKMARNIGFEKVFHPILNPQLLNFWLSYKIRLSEIILAKVYKSIPDKLLSFLGYNSLYIKLRK